MKKKDRKIIRKIIRKELIRSKSIKVLLRREKCLEPIGPFYKPGEEPDYLKRLMDEFPLNSLAEVRAREEEKLKWLCATGPTEPETE